MSSTSPAAPFTPGYNPQAVAPQRTDRTDQGAERQRDKVAEAESGSSTTGDPSGKGSGQGASRGAVLDIRA
ncbi:hypothetical protein LRS10_10525 [Phenylobacterium sp. J426]|uniref:hypothetical protein n=1 Tax=Phenylobacterium sp. J426 TaxID=2898439 RepID=UPI002150A699|nr:hypothetical protein [Phenylobacterium sp. J426]MCR5874561.1 hypothetical protein [Phenylobacterium sp. J426]